MGFRHVNTAMDAQERRRVMATYMYSIQFYTHSTQMVDAWPHQLTQSDGTIGTEKNVPSFDVTVDTALFVQEGQGLKHLL